jgi:hypothetical protein
LGFLQTDRLRRHPLTLPSPPQKGRGKTRRYMLF